MPSPTYVALAKTVLTGTQAIIDFTGISNVYTDLILSISSRSNASALTDTLQILINSDTSSLYSNTTISGNGSTPSSTRSSNDGSVRFLGGATGANATANTFGSAELYIPNYAGSTNKVLSGNVASETNASTLVFVAGVAGLYSNTSAITAIRIQLNFGSFVSGSRFDLYGIKNS